MDQVGVCTVGYGSTTDVELGERITQAEAESRLAEDVETAEECINKWVVVPLTQNQFDALTSWVFNLGCKRFQGSTMLKCINESKWDQASVELRKWCNAGGRPVDGLIRRRTAEAKLFDTKETA